MENMDNPQEELNNIISLTDEEGQEVEFEYLDLIAYEGQEYMVLIPANDDENAEVTILAVESQDGELETYVSVSDPEILDAVYEIFKEHFRDVFTFEA